MVITKRQTVGEIIGVLAAVYSCHFLIQLRIKLCIIDFKLVSENDHS